MTEKHNRSVRPDEQVPQTEVDQGSSAMDRRRFVNGLGLLAAGSLTSSAAVAQTGEAATAAGSAEAVAVLEQQTQRAQRWAGRDPGDWVRPRAGVDHNVVIVGGGQSGIALAYGLRRKGVGKVEVIDSAAPGQAGIWRSVARMHNLRTPKAIIGIERDNPMLAFRAWYETLNGSGAFNALDRIPRLAWADYVDWFQQVTATTVRYRTRLLEIEPQGDLLRLHLETEGVRRVETTRKVLLANGYAAAGGANVPGFMRSLPGEFWTHTSDQIPLDTLAGKVVGVVGAGSSAFDAAAVALESGAVEVQLFNRRSFVGYPGGANASGPSDRGHANAREMEGDLPDVVRWRNFLRGDRSIATVPLDSIERVMAHDQFRLHLESSLANVDVDGGQIVANVRGETRRFDQLIAGTGYQINLSAQPELAGIYDSIALWRDRYEPESGEGSVAGGMHPYLGASFEFLPRGDSGAEYLRNIHCFNLSARLSFGMPIGDIPSSVDHPRLIATIARDLYAESIDTGVHERFFSSPLATYDPTPYESAVQPPSTEAAV